MADGNTQPVAATLVLDYAYAMFTFQNMRLVLLFLLGCLMPVAALYFGIVPFRFRFVVLVVIALGLAVYARLSGLAGRDLGFRKDTLKSSLLVNGTASAVLSIGLWAAYAGGLVREPTVPQWSLFFPFYVLISSPCQEFIYRSVVFAEMNRAGLKSAVLQVIISALNYSLLHVIYRDWLTLLATALIGVGWGVIYRRYPNFWGVALFARRLGRHLDTDRTDLVGGIGARPASPDREARMSL